MSSTLIDQIIEPFSELLTVEAAQKIVDLRANPAIQSRIDELADKANRGVMSDEERTEYDRHLAAFHFVTIMQAKARRLLKS